ncbi:MAG TPA: signal peptidase I [Candidatus Obscuribacter sp.]|nr:signal peptidase I [Candidatus Obscuribacter sp.]MDX1987567.1 signal peptidase I [Candidatus Obscuribacter sp.]HMW88982.1 signal peptidase I [Candidatus Obscuribacter sp.]HMX47494.1 signal peptidase I [Candidatus Obscuribacter sp.]HMY53546.1 signal peptidase I [Candidatus Obscuribacter sp.]
MTATQAPPQTEKPTPGGFLTGFLKEAIELIVVTLALLIAIRWGIAEARYIPSSSMEPTLQINDRLIVEKISGHLGKKIERGDILVFYPPKEEMGGQDLSNNPLHIMGRLTGLPCFPNDPAFIKRCIGIPGDQIRVQANQGVYINQQLLDESAYVKEPPAYNLNVMGDIKGRNALGMFIQAERDPKKQMDPIIVPAGHLFMMGDNRNNSEDSHVWGFLDQRRVIGRAYLLIWRRLEAPKYPISLQSGE